MLKSGSYNHFPRRRKQKNVLPAAFLIVVILSGGLYLYLSSPRPGPEPSARLEYTALLKDNFRSDAEARADLLAISRHNIPAYARLAKIDSTGTWSLLCLGPFKSREEALSGLDVLKNSRLYMGEWEIADSDDEFSQFSGLWRPVAVELSALLTDELILEELSYPRERGIYAFARTAEVTGWGEAWNHIYLGPFESQSEAIEGLEKLSSWDIGRDFSIIPLLSD